MYTVGKQKPCPGDHLLLIDHMRNGHGTTQEHGKAGASVVAGNAEGRTKKPGGWLCQAPRRTWPQEHCGCTLGGRGAPGSQAELPGGHTCGASVEEARATPGDEKPGARVARKLQVMELTGPCVACVQQVSKVRRPQVVRRAASVGTKDLQVDAVTGQ